jgi:transposase InsO family protein
MNPSVCQDWKRGWPAQRERREAERDARRHTVAFDHWAGQLGLKHEESAAALGLAPGTLAFWEYRSRDEDLAAHALGRPCNRSNPRMRNEAIGLMRGEGLRVTMAAVQANFPKLARREVQSLHARFRWHCRKQGQRLLHVLHWHWPGAVWAMDHVQPSQAIDGRWPYVLSIRDLSSGCQLAWLPVLGETSDATVEALQWLLLEHGPPLVLKCDNGSGFTAERTRRFLDRWQVTPLFSPPYLPEYNGGIEAGNGALENYTCEKAALAGHIGHWTADDCEAARRMANELTYPRGPSQPTPKATFAARQRISAEARAAFRRSVAEQQDQERIAQKYPLDIDLDLKDQDAIDRVAIRRALVEHGILTFTRRSITPQLKSKIPLKVS